MSIHQPLRLRATVSVKALRDAMAKVGRAIERRNTIPILGAFHLKVAEDYLEITGTNLDLEAVARVPISGGEPGVLCVGGAHLLRMMRHLPNWEAISIREGDDLRLIVDMPDGRASVIGTPSKDFPFIQWKGEASAVSVPSADFLSALERVRPFISDEETRYYLNGIFIKGDGQNAEFVATNGHQLGKLTTACPGWEIIKGAILPRGGVDYLRKVLRPSGQELSISVNPFPHTLMSFATADGLFKLTTKLIDGKYPDYQRVIPRDATAELEIARQCWIDKTKRVLAFAAESFRSAEMTLSFGNDVISATTGNSDFGEMVVAFPGRSDALFELGVNPRFLIDVLAAHRAESLRLVYSGDGSPTQFVSDDMVTLIMPLRCSSKSIALPDGAVA